MTHNTTQIPEEHAIHDWNEVGHTRPVFRANIELCDETLRDGIQSPSVIDPDINTKLELVNLMDKLGVTIADIGLPGAGPRAVEDVTTIAKYIGDNNLNLKAMTAARTVIRDIVYLIVCSSNIAMYYGACSLQTKTSEASSGLPARLRELFNAPKR